ncbi:hypothetical protein RBG11_004233 [Vibrio parahaemolyticus]|nr:hypothetical protein [Vibrio parahaemolyticus]
MITDIFNSGKKYEIIYADPAWDYKDKCNSGKRGASHKYTTTGLESLMQLPVAEIAADDCILFMWHVPPMPQEALDLVAAWGFQFKTMKGFTWVKLNKRAMTPFMGMGNYTRSNAEDCLIAIKGNPKRLSAKVRSMVFEEQTELVIAPMTGHSRKPPEVRDRIVELMGDLPRIELFSRDIVDGWDCWGNHFETE